MRTSSNMNNLTPLPGARRATDRAYDVQTSNNDRHAVTVFHISHSTRATQDNMGSGVHDPRRLREVRAPMGFHSIPNCPAQPNSRQVYIHRGDNRRYHNPRPREIFRQPSPRTSFQTRAEVPQPVENLRSAALSKLKKEVYNPTPKREASTVLSSYNRDNNEVTGSEVRERQNDEGKRCAICLEDFEAKEEVMVTPCNHMFHEECIVPWLTSSDQCPVCRFVMSDRERENPSSFYNRNNNFATLEPANLIAGEFLSILRAMEEVFHLGNGIH